jgi:hypothetical protein
MSIAEVWRTVRTGQLTRWVPWIAPAMNRRASRELAVDSAARHRMPDARADALLDALTRALRLAERLPSEVREDDARRSLCELIEATQVGAARDARVQRVRSSIARLRDVSARLLPAQQTPSNDVERFAIVVETEVLPLLLESDRITPPPRFAVR